METLHICHTYSRLKPSPMIVQPDVPINLAKRYYSLSIQLLIVIPNEHHNKSIKIFSILEYTSNTDLTF